MSTHAHHTADLELSQPTSAQGFCKVSSLVAGYVATVRLAVCLYCAPGGGGGEGVLGSSSTGGVMEGEGQCARQAFP